MSLLNRKSLNIEQVKGRFGLHSQVFLFKVADVVEFATFVGEFRRW